MLASAVLAFTLSFDEFIITLFLIGGDQTLPLYIFTHVRYGITPAVNAVASLFLLGSFAALSLAFACASIVRLPKRSSSQRGERRDQVDRRKVTFGGRHAAAHPDACRKRGLGDPSQSRPVRVIQIGVDVVERPPGGAGGGRERQRVRPAAFARHAGDCLGVVEERQRAQRCAEHQHAATGLDESGERRAGAEAVAERVGGSQPVRQPADGNHTLVRVGALRAPGHVRSRWWQPAVPLFASDSSGSNPGISSR